MRIVIPCMVILVGLSVGAPIFSAEPTSRPARGAATAPTPRRVVYLISFGGSMITMTDSTRVLARQQIDALDGSESFGLVTYHKGEAQQLSKEPIRATPAGKKQAFDFLDHSAPNGPSTPKPGLEAAMAMKPDVIEWMSNGVGIDVGMVKAARELNPKGATKINMTYFRDNGKKQDNEGLDEVKLIAKQSGGVFHLQVEKKP